MEARREGMMETGDTRSARRAQLAQLAQEIRPARQTRLGDDVYHSLYRLISTGEMAFGSKLPSEGELCRLFAVSRPVVRTALARLREEGLVRSRKGSGTYVSGVNAARERAEDPRDELRAILHALEFRRSIEPDAAYYAALRRNAEQLDRLTEALDDFGRSVEERKVARRVDFAFHLAIATAAQNHYYVAGLQAIEYDIDLGVTLARDLSHLGQTERRQAIHIEHAAIYAGIRDQDPPAASAAMQRHLEHSQLRVISRGEEILRRAQTADT